MNLRPFRHTKQTETAPANRVQRVAQHRNQTSTVRRRVLGPTAAAIVLMLGIGAGSAYAYWKSTGLGTGQATTGTSQAVTIATNATAGTLLQPGGTGDLVITATNPNAAPVQITAITLGAIGGCTTPAISLAAPSTSYLPFTIPANANNQRLVVAGALTMGTGASSGCQGVAFTIPLTVTVHQ